MQKYGEFPMIKYIDLFQTSQAQFNLQVNLKESVNMMCEYDIKRGNLLVFKSMKQILNQIYYCRVSLYGASPGIDQFVNIKIKEFVMMSHACAPSI